MHVVARIKRFARRLGDALPVPHEAPVDGGLGQRGGAPRARALLVQRAGDVAPGHVLDLSHMLDVVVLGVVLRQLLARRYAGCAGRNAEFLLQLVGARREECGQRGGFVVGGVVGTGALGGVG